MKKLGNLFVVFLILTLGLISCNEIEDPPSPITEAPIGANMVEVQVTF